MKITTLQSNESLSLYNCVFFIKTANGSRQYKRESDSLVNHYFVLSFSAQMF